MIAAMEQLIPQPTKRMTEQEYLRMEEAAETKHEFWHGTIIDMAGSTGEHSAIATNLTTELSNRLKGKPCRAYNSDLRVRIDEFGHYCYPDAMVVCGPLQYALANRHTTIINPQVVIEVASPSSESRDLGEKFDDYREIPSLLEYFVVSQDRVRVQSFYRQSDGVWAFGPSYVALNQAVKFRTLGCEIPLTEIYAGVEFPPAPVRTPEV
jgi:Uma2 family endonuclease